MTSQQPRASLPQWILWYTGFLALLGYGAGALAVFAPGYLWMNVQVDFGLVVSITTMFAARNVALGTLAVFALWRRDPKYLFMVFLARFVVELLDLVITLATNIVNAPALVIIIAWSIIFLLPEFIALIALSRHTRS